MELKMRLIFDKNDRNYLILFDYEKRKITYTTSVSATNSKRSPKTLKHDFLFVSFSFSLLFEEKRKFQI